MQRWEGRPGERTVERTLREQWPFVGRDRELDVVVDAVGTPHAPSGAVIVAPAGLGKTRLAREASERATGFSARWAVGTAAASTIPYGALAHLAPSIRPGDFADVVSFHSAFVTALTSQETEPALLVVDDAHLLDPGSAALLLRILVTRSAAVIATVRLGEPQPDPIAALWRDGFASRIDLAALVLDDAAALVRSALGGDIVEPDLHRILELTGGAPLHIREFVIAAAETGSLRNLDGLWTWDGAVALPARLVDAVGGRLDMLAAAERTALALLALGEPLERDLAERVCDGAALLTLEHSGLVRRVDSPAEASEPIYRLEHPLFGEVVLARVRSAERRRLLGDLAAVASDAHPSGGSRLRLARWQLDSGVRPDVALLVEAARDANAVFAFDEGRRFAEAAVDRGGGVAASVVLGSALVGLGAFAAAAETLAAVESAAHHDPCATVWRDHLFGQVMALHQGLGEDSAAEAVLDRFRASRDDAPARHLEAALRGMIALSSGRMVEAMEGASAVLQAPDAADRSVVLAAEVAGEALIYLGESAQARAVHGRLRELAEAEGPEAARAGGNVALQEILCMLQEGSLAEAERLVAANYHRWIPGYDDTTLGLAAFALGSVQLLRGRPGQARASLRESAACLHRADVGGSLAWVLAVTAQCEALLGDGRAAQASLERAEQLPLGRERARSRLDFALAEVRVRVALGDRTGAARIAVRRTEQLAEMPVHRARLLDTALRLGQPAATIAPLLATTASSCSSRLPALLAEHAAALAARDADALERLSEQFEHFGLGLEAAEASATAARMLGAGPRSERAWARSRRLAEACEGSRAVTLSRGADEPVLTRREWEVARLAASGLSSPAIAERLTLSVRTVESHIYRVFGKLGVRRRAELADALERIIQP